MRTNRINRELLKKLRKSKRSGKGYDLNDIVEVELNVIENYYKKIEILKELQELYPNLENDEE